MKSHKHCNCTQMCYKKRTKENTKPEEEKINNFWVHFENGSQKAVKVLKLRFLDGISKFQVIYEFMKLFVNVWNLIHFSKFFQTKNKKKKMLQLICDYFSIDFFGISNSQFEIGSRCCCFFFLFSKTCTFKHGVDMSHEK